MGVAADLRYGWADSARALLRRATSPAAARERDAWIVLAGVAGLAPLGTPGTSAARLATHVRNEADPDVVELWLLAALPAGPDQARAAERLRAAAAGGAPLAAALAASLEARRMLTVGDSAGAIARWTAATARYDVLSVPSGLLSSLWPQRLTLARAAVLAGDSASAARACATLSAPIGYADQAAFAEVEPLCAPWRGVTPSPRR
jgi:hypothetical protein